MAELAVCGLLSPGQSWAGPGVEEGISSLLSRHVLEPVACEQGLRRPSWGEETGGAESQGVPCGEGGSSLTFAL